MQVSPEGLGDFDLFFLPSIKYRPKKILIRNPNPMMKYKLFLHICLAGVLVIEFWLTQMVAAVQGGFTGLLCVSLGVIDPIYANRLQMKGVCMISSKC